MDINITGRRLKVWPELRDVAVETVQKFGKLNDKITQVDVVLSEEHGKTVEFTVYVNNRSYNAGDTAESFDRCIHVAGEKITAQLRKLKEKQSEHR